ncbi:DUF6194 family protein [Haloferax profundi]|uniref:DUF6194 domain-containing protein n=1 Tax=Haloferax profundi TaxID=1544718 RepID=A0A0W1SPX7_9EURY|nr:DUF6194 family protein [Haloferax profundi]KTG28344.1 hypothetical protein AUR66_12105 [Haloferax profundi]
MNPDDFLRYVTDRYDDVVADEAWGEQGLFYNPGGRLPRGTYFVTVKARDSENDAASQLYREEAWRVNLGIGDATYRRLFGARPERPPKGGVVDTGHDFTALDELHPHPVYGWAGWVSVVSPSETTVETVLRPLLDEAYDRAGAQFSKRVSAASATAGQ